MTSPTGLKLWIEGARLRTLPAAIAPVAVGTGAAAFDDGVVWWKALLALGVSLALQIGVNYANDYSDGIKGTDDDRVGPLRLVGSGLVAPAKVKARRSRFLGLGAALGLVLAATSGWWLHRRRRRRDPRGVGLHRRLQALRLPRTRRGQRVRLLRPRRRARHHLRPARAPSTT